MAEYIRKQDAVDTVPKERIVEYMDEFGAGFNSCRNEMLRTVEALPPADVVSAEELKAEIYKLKHQSEQSSGNHDYYVGYISALSTVEGILAVMDREE